MTFSNGFCYTLLVLWCAITYMGYGTEDDEDLGIFSIILHKQNFYENLFINYGN